MFSSHALRGIIISGLLFSVVLQAQQPINLDDAAHTFSSITIPSKPEPRTFSPYLISGIATYLVSGFCYGFAAGIYSRYSSLPWWQTWKKSQSISTGIKAAATISGLYWTHKTIETRRHTLNSIREKARKIIGACSLLDAIKTDNVEHIKAWIAYDEALLHLDYGSNITEYALSQSSLFAKRDHNGRTAIMLATLANSIKVLEIMLSYQKKYSAIDVCDNQGNTAIHMAVQNKHYEAAELLMQHGANPYFKNNAGKLPGDLIEWSPAAASALGIEQASPAKSSTNKSYYQKAKDHLVEAAAGVTALFLVWSLRNLL